MVDSKFSGVPSVSASDEAKLRSALARGATRRDVMYGLVAAGMGIAAASSLTDFVTRAHAQTPKKGGALRVAGSAGGTADTLDPARGSNSSDYTRSYMFYSGLTEVDEDVAPQPKLAESWDHEDSTVWVFRLRPDVQFHDGSALTADDVVYSLVRHKDPETGSKVKAIADQFEKVEASGKNEVTVTLAAPNADFPVLLAQSHFTIIKDGTTDFATANGTGAYKVEAFSPGLKTVGVRNDSYFMPDRGHFDSVEYANISDAEARLSALLTGEIHISMAMLPAQAKRLNDPNIKILETVGGTYIDLIFRQDVAPTNNRDFVLGMKYMFDRELMVEQLFQGYGVVANDHPIPPTNRWFCEDLAQREFDPEKAKFHLQKAGVLDAGPMEIVGSTGASLSLDMAVMLQQVGKEIGFELDIRRAPSDGYWSNVWMKVPLGFGVISGRPTPDLAFTLFYKSDAAYNESGWNNEQFDQLLVAARGEADETKRAQMYCDMQELVKDFGGTAIPLFYNNIDGYTSRLGGFFPIPTGNMQGYQFAERAWFEA